MSEGLKARLVALFVLAALATGCDWVQFRAGPGHLGATTDGAAPAYVSGLIRQWAATTGGPVASSPARSAGLVYVGSDDHKLYACSTPPRASRRGRPPPAARCARPRRSTGRRSTWAPTTTSCTCSTPPPGAPCGR